MGRPRRTWCSSIGTAGTASTAGAAAQWMTSGSSENRSLGSHRFGRLRWDESMIARHEAHMDKMDIWASLAAPLPAGVVSWRQDGKPTQRDGKYFARFVAYIEANTVRERLDSVVPGEWDLTLELLPALPGVDSDASCSFKARLQILGVIREDVGTGRDYKQAATDAFKRSAVRFGIAHELYAYEQSWVQVDGDGKYAKPLEDPQTAYNRRYGSAKPVASVAAAPAKKERASREKTQVQV